jgi:predicted nucleic acid-binding protein
MKRVFADTLYWIVIAFPQDAWHVAAHEARKRLGDVHIVTNDAILTEFLAALSGAGGFYRQQAVQMVRVMLAD